MDNLNSNSVTIPLLPPSSSRIRPLHTPRRHNQGIKIRVTCRNSIIALLSLFLSIFAIVFALVEYYKPFPHTMLQWPIIYDPSRPNAGEPASPVLTERMLFDVYVKVIANVSGDVRELVGILSESFARIFPCSAF